MGVNDIFLRLGVSLAIGLLFGIERAWNLHTEAHDLPASGIRSYALAGLIGGVAGVLGETLGVVLVASVFLGFVGVFSAYQWRESVASGSFSVTSALAGVLTFLLGTLAAIGDSQVAVAAAIVATAILALREALHKWINALTAVEIRDGLILLAMAFLLLPLLPDRSIDPWGMLNLREIWILTTSIAGVSFLGYVAVRGLGPRWGILVTAAAGGLASSTATTISLARLARTATPARLLVAGMLIAACVMLVRVMVIAGALQPALLPLLVLPIGAGLVTYLAAAFWLERKELAPGMPELGIRSPLDLLGALRMVALIGGVILISGLTLRNFGSAGLYVVAALSGLADVDAITISSARMTGNPQVSATAILIAVTSNSLVKAFLAAWIGRPIIGARFLIPTLAGIAAGAAAYTLV